MEQNYTLNQELTLLPPPDKRLLIDLEFVQNLANVRYVSFLAQQKYFDKPEFINYLRYLRYWKQPEYAQHLLFPQCLAFLEALIDNEEFRREIALPQFVDFVHQQQGLYWMKGENVSLPSAVNNEATDDSKMDTST